MKRFTIAVIVCALGCADASEPQLQPENESTPLFEFTDSEQETVTETRDEFVDTTWVAQRIGDATSTQDWWHFGESSEFHRSLVRLSEPNSLSLERFNGSWTYEAGTVFVEARSLTSEFEWTFTGHPDDDVLLTHSFVETAPQRFERSARVIERGDEFVDRDLVVVVEFDSDPFTSPVCEMSVTLDLTLSIYEDESEAYETMQFPCSIKEDESGRKFVSADYDGTWFDVFELHGIWSRYPAFLSNALFSSFRPTLYPTDRDAVMAERGPDFERQKTDRALPERASDISFDL